MAELIFFFIICIPVFLILIWQIYNPEDAVLWGKRWMYKEQPEVSDEAIKYTKIMSIIALIVLGFIFVVLFIRMI
ncbi:hypothetical protein SLU01_31840 [Sporosarcina luteola]|uniref:DUF6199 domain-containing protein n=1 Tax=Sporosarcina luteola TaxID=582850 RepID=A0A511ZBQ4_9BACL|nr:hypothetical protein [Sporosarcina luteola]GEN84872.1 hypothetical protein SLU01_31840 [Sporosarcina luteola]